MAKIDEAIRVLRNAAGPSISGNWRVFEDRARKGLAELLESIEDDTSNDDELEDLKTQVNELAAKLAEVEDSEAVRESDIEKVRDLLNESNSTAKDVVTARDYLNEHYPAESEESEQSEDETKGEDEEAAPDESTDEQDGEPKQ